MERGSCDIRVYAASLAALVSVLSEELEEPNRASSTVEAA